MFSPTTGKLVDAQESISKEDLEDELELHHVEASVEQISPTVFDLESSKVPPASLTVGEVCGVRDSKPEQTQSCVTVWLSGPEMGLEEAHQLQGTLGQLKQLTKFASFQGAITSNGLVGLRFGDMEEATKYMSSRNGKLSATLPTWTDAKAFTLGFEKVVAPTAGSGHCGHCPVPTATMTGPHGLPKPAMTGLLSHLHHLTQRRATVEAPNALRIWDVLGTFEDVEVRPQQDMQMIYEKLRKERPGSILVKLPEAQEAVLPSDPMPVGEVLLIPPMSLPLALPTEFQVPVGSAGERDIDFALMREILCEMLGDYKCVKKDSAESSVLTFRHVREKWSRNKLVVVKSAMSYLNDVIRHRKVAFLSIVGKPREGKSTLLELIRRLFAGQDGLPLFRCSNSWEKACTAGLWVSTQALPTRPGDQRDDSDASVMLMLDTEGLFADEGITPDYFVRLFTMVGVLSSVMILNNKISNTVAEEFKAPLIRLAMLYKGFFEQNPWFRDHRPRVLYLARDWNEDQDLIKDTDAWNDAEERCGEDGPLRDAMNFVKEAFGVVKFGTLPAPIAELDKKDIISKTLDPRFKRKLADIMERIVKQWLTPKSLANANGSTCYITGSDPLFELLHSTVEAPTTEIAWDWQGTLQRFREKATLEKLEAEVILLAGQYWKAQGGRSMGLTVEARDVAGEQRVLKLVLKNAQEAGLAVSTSSTSTVEVFGPPIQLETFVSRYLREDSLKIKISFDALMQSIENEQRSIHEEATKEFASLGYCPDMVADLVQSQCRKHFGQILALANSLSQLCGERELNFAMKRVESQISAAASAEQVSEIQMSFERETCAALKDFGSDKIALALDEVAKRAQATAARPRQLAEQKAQYFALRKLEINHVNAESLEEAFGKIDAEKLFAAQFRPEDLVFVETLVLEALKQPTEPVLCKYQDARALAKEQLDLVDQVLFAEKCRRLHIELCQLLAPVCHDSKLLWDISHDFLDIVQDDPQSDPSIALSELLQGAVQVGSGDQLAAIEEMKALASSDPVSHGRSGLDPRLRKSLQTSILSFCESIVEASFSDFQVALFGDERQIHNSLKEAGVSLYTLKQLKTCWPNTSFAVALSSREDLQKIVALQSTYKPFQHMGVRLPSVLWVSKFSQKAVDRWKDHVRRACKEIDVIEYKESFGQEVASLYEAGNNCFSAAGESVELRVRFSLVLFPVSFSVSEGMSDMLRKALPDVQLDLDSLMVLEHKGGESGRGGKIGIVSGEAFNEIHFALKHPRKLRLERDERSPTFVLAVTLSDWVYTFGSLDALHNQWEAVQQEICMSAKRQAQQGYKTSQATSRVEEAKSRWINMGRASSSKHTSEVSHHRSKPNRESFGDDFGFDQIDVEIQDRVDDMAGIYNDAAINADFEGAEMDMYGNPIGGNFDLARDGAFEGFKILVFCGYHGEGLPNDLQRLTIPELSKKGFQVKTCMQVDEFTQELRSKQYHVAWIISGSSFQGNKDAFLAEIEKFHDAGRGLMIWGDNDPFFVHANAVLGKLFGFQLEGNTPGGKELHPGDPLKPGFFGGHPKVCAGIVKLHEGVTICYPKHVPDGWKVFGTSSNQKPVLLAKEASSERPGKCGTGRVIVDNGFTKIYKGQWTTAGTPRYVSNCSAWLVLRERFRRPQWGFNPTPQYQGGA